jgi:hypothetical protein
MMLPFDGLSVLAEGLLFVSALVGPQNYRGPLISFQKKLEALARFEHSGDAQDCRDVLAAIRNRKASAQDDLESVLRAQKQLDAGVANDIRLLQLQGDSPEMKIVRQKTLDATLGFQRTVNLSGIRSMALVEAHTQEEAVFRQLYETIRARQSERKAP